MTAQKRTFSRGGIRPAQAHEKNGLDRAKTGAQNDPMKIGYARVSRCYVPPLNRLSLLRNPRVRQDLAWNILR
jgi:hypothetical protein